MVRPPAASAGPAGPAPWSERLLFALSEPERRQSLFFYANLIAYLMLVGGMMLMVLLLLGRL